MHSLTIFLILINILQISHQAPDHDKRRCSEKGCFPAFWKKIFGPKMRKLRKSEFLDFKEETLEDWEKFGDEKCSCGKYSLKEMQKIEYDDDWHFRVLPKPIGKGSTSMIYHAHAMTMSKLKDFDGKPLKLKKCFALKSVLIRKVGYELENEMRNEIEILKRFARINSKRIIRLYDFKDVGKLSKNRQRKLLFLIEMGEHDLFEEFKNMKNIMENIWHRNKDKSEIEKIIKNKFIEILEAVKEMHKLAIHLDLKPENMIYVNEGNKMALKIIDFGGSELIPENSKNIAEKRANVCKLRKEMWHTEFYASPEQRTCCDNYRNYNFSIKSDIWSVGVMLLEMITYAPMYKNGIAQFPVDWALELIKEMFEKGGDLIEIERQGIRLHDILVTLRDQFSHLFSSILKTTVNKVPTERTTARGLLDFIPGKCHLKVPLKRIVDKSNPNKVVETIFEQNTQQEMLLPECDQETTGNPLALSDEVKSNELKVKLEENIVV